MKSVAVRVYAVIAIMAVAYGVSRLVQAGIEPPEVEMPKWTFRDLPMTLGVWNGENTKLDPEIAAATGAQIIVDRIYHDDLGRMISLHTAMFDRPGDGVLHSPINCYRGSGWRLVNETREEVSVAPDRSIQVALTTWEREGETVMVVYWYQLGNHILYSRFDLGAMRWELRGQPKWPVLMKVMLQTQVTNPSDPGESQELILNFAKQIAQWLNQPEHQKYLDRWSGV